jgi:uncharacterized OB-fold protein
LDDHQDSMPPSLDEVTTELAAPLVATGEACPNCGARMAADQRYCIHCGERRSGGGLREALPRTQTVAAAAVPPRRPRLSANSSLIAGIATLLIAMGVGVLIGRTDNAPGKSAGNAPMQVVTVPAGATAAGAGAATTAAAGTTTKSKKSKKSKSKHAAASSGTTKGADGKVVKLPPRVVTVGGSCDKGTKGCQGGKFTGNYFGQ